MRTLQTPTGFLVEDRPTGLYLLGDEDTLNQAKGFVHWNEGLRTHERKLENWTKTTVEIGYSDEEFIPGTGAEWGTGKNRDEAWRYALGAHFGSYDDPEIP